MTERIRLFAEHHIVAVRTGRRNGEIIAVKHVTFGWISPQAYYGLQKVHDAMPIFLKLIESGYRLKWALANVTVLDIPLGGLGYGLALGRSITLLEHATLDPLFKKADGTPDYEGEAALWLGSVFLPFGEILWVILAKAAYDYYAGVPGQVTKAVGDYFGSIFGAVTDWVKQFIPSSGGTITEGIGLAPGAAGK